LENLNLSVISDSPQKNWVTVVVAISAIAMRPVDVINPSIFWREIAKTHNLVKISKMSAPVVTPVNGYFVT
jgi:hypothetical protein